MLGQCLRGLAQRARGIDQVIHDQARPVLDIPDQVHDLGDVHLLATLIDNRQRCIQAFGEGPRAFHTARIELAERLDGANGLLLSPHIDHLFDEGYITFSSRQELVIVPEVRDKLLDAWGIDAGVRNGFESIRAVFSVDGEAESEALAGLVEQSRKRSAVYDVLTHGTSVSVEVAGR